MGFRSLRLRRSSAFGPYIKPFFNLGAKCGNHARSSPLSPARNQATPAAKDIFIVKAFAVLLERALENFRPT